MDGEQETLPYERSDGAIPTRLLQAIILASLATLLLAVALAGCGENGLGPDDGGADLQPAADLSAPPDLSPPRRDPTDHPPLFHLDSQGGPTLAAMEIYTVVWKGDEALGARMDAFHEAMLQSDYWTSRLGQYAVGHGHGKGVLVLADPPPVSIDGSVLDKMVGDHIKSGAWPAPNANTVFAYIVNANTTVTSWGETGCTSFGGYHEESAGHVPYIVNLQCDSSFDSLTFVASHEAAECATDPHVSTAPGYYTVGAGEIGDVCMGTPHVISDPNPPDGGVATKYQVTQLYSNQDALKGNVDPCGPTPPNQPFFNVALAPTQIALTTDATGVGDVSAMIEPFAYGPVGTLQWQVTLNLGLGAPGVTVSPQKGSGQPGDTIPIHFHATAQAQPGPMSVSIYVQAKNGWTNTWYSTLNIQ